MLVAMAVMVIMAVMIMAMIVIMTVAMVMMMTMIMPVTMMVHMRQCIVTGRRLEQFLRCDLLLSGLGHLQNMVDDFVLENRRP